MHCPNQVPPTVIRTSGGKSDILISTCALSAGMASPSQKGQGKNGKNGIYCKAALVALCLKEKWESVVADGLQGKSLTTAVL